MVYVEMAEEVDEREQKLPVWAKDKLATMRRAVAESRAELAALKNGGAHGPFWLEGWGGKDRWYLPREAGRLMYGKPDGEWELQLTGDLALRPKGFLNINARTSIIAMPSASNVLLVRNE